MMSRREQLTNIEVLDTLGIKKAVFVGHSIAGSELSEIAVKYPSYVDKLVYLDASDLSLRFDKFPEVPLPFMLFTDADAKSLFTFQAAYARFLGVRIPIPAFCLSSRPVLLLPPRYTCTPALTSLRCLS